MIYVGIDPGVETGFATYNTETKEHALSTLTFWSAIYAINVIQSLGDLTVVIENPNLNKPVFFRGLNAMKNLRVAQNVGANKRDAQLLIDYCKDRKIPLIEVRPSANTYSKLSAEQFEKITGIKDRTSSHSRDAYMLIFGRII